MCHNLMVKSSLCMIKRIGRQGFEFLSSPGLSWAHFYSKRRGDKKDCRCFGATVLQKARPLHKKTHRYKIAMCHPNGHTVLPILRGRCVFCHQKAQEGPFPLQASL